MQKENSLLARNRRGSITKGQIDWLAGWRFSQKRTSRDFRIILSTNRFQRYKHIELNREKREYSIYHVCKFFMNIWFMSFIINSMFISVHPTFHIKEIT